MILQTTKRALAMTIALILSANAYAQEEGLMSECEVTKLIPEHADLFVFQGRLAPQLGAKLLFDFSKPTIEEIAYVGVGNLAFGGDIVLSASSSFFGFGNYSGIRYGQNGTYLVLLSGQMNPETNDGTFNRVLRISRGAFEVTDEDVIFNSEIIHSAELNCVVQNTDEG